MAPAPPARWKRAGGGRGPDGLSFLSARGAGPRSGPAARPGPKAPAVAGPGTVHPRCGQSLVGLRGVFLMKQDRRSGGRRCLGSRGALCPGPSGCLGGVLPSPPSPHPPPAPFCFVHDPDCLACCPVGPQRPRVPAPGSRRLRPPRPSLPGFRFRPRLPGHCFQVQSQRTRTLPAGHHEIPHFAVSGQHTAGDAREAPASGV